LGFSVPFIAGDVRDLYFLLLASLFLELVLGGLCSAKDPQTPKGGLRRGEEKEVVAALLLFPPP
jgi:hypothetical protein